MEIPWNFCVKKPWGISVRGVPYQKTEAASHVINPYPGARRQSQTEMFSDHDETSPIDRSSFSSVDSLSHARGAATEKALSPIRRRVRGTTRLPHDEARSVDRPGILATDVRRSEIFRRVSRKRLVNQQAQLASKVKRTKRNKVRNVVSAMIVLRRHSATRLALPLT